MISFDYNDEKLTFRVEHYQEGNAICICIDDEHKMPYATLTTNIPEVKLGENEVLIKNWTENKRLANHLRDSEYFVDTGKRIRAGYCWAEVWYIRPEILEKMKK